MISQTAEYALRAMVQLAAHPGLPQTTRQISAVTHVPVPYLSKVLQSLGRAGLISSQRGLHGGSLLLRPPGEITILDVVEAVDPLPRIRSCPLGLKAHGTNLCPLHRRLDGAMDAVEESFRRTTLAELIEDPVRREPLCPFPGVDEQPCDQAAA